MSAALQPSSQGPLPAWVAAARRLLPGVALCVAVTLTAMGLEWIEVKLSGRAWLDALVLAILVGTALRTAWAPGETWKPGIAFSAKTLLEIAVVLLGASLSAATLLAVGYGMLFGIAGIVLVAIVMSYGIARALDLPPRMAMLIACGNSICGNSAIAAVAPIIGAKSDEVASSIAFTAVLGVIVVLALPFLIPALGLSATQYGVLSGLTVYAVPQVLAATAPAGALAVQTGTLVKLVRVLMLGPLVLVLSLASSRIRGDGNTGAARGKVPFSRLVPWFIIGFLTMAGLRTAGLIPEALLPALSTLAKVLTIVSMAALGLGVDIRTVAKAGPRVTLAVTLSLIGLAAISFGLIRLLGVA